MSLSAPTFGSITRFSTAGSISEPNFGSITDNAFDPLQLFSANQQGALYISEPQYLYQDSAGTTPVTADNDPVGLMLDTRIWDGRGVVNLLTYTQQFDNVVWGASGNITRVPNVAIAPDGTLTADRAEVTTGGASTTGLRSGLIATSTQMVYSLYMKKGTSASLMNVVGIRNSTGAKNLLFVDVNLDTGAIGIIAGVDGSATATNVGNGWWRIRLAILTSIAIGDSLGIYYCASGQTNLATGDHTFIWGAQLEEGSEATTYQPNGATVGGPGNHATQSTSASRLTYNVTAGLHKAAFDETAKHMTAAAGGGGTSGILLAVAITPDGTGTARTIWSDTGTNTGYKLTLGTSDQITLSAGNGSAFTSVVGPALTDGTTYVVVAWHDGVNLNIQVNNGAITSQAFTTATAGTDGFTIGKDNGAASGFFGDDLYGLIYRKNDTSTASQRLQSARYLARRSGVGL